jgi:hypothetical protein
MGWTSSEARCTIIVVAASRLDKENAMQTLCVSEKTRSDGILRLRIPVGEPEAEYDAVVVLQPRTAGPPPSVPEALGWPLGYFERTFGSITDESFLRPPQGELPEAVELE